jgi:hypothetical protein
VDVIVTEIELCPRQVADKLNAQRAEGWEIDHMTAALLTTGRISPRGSTAATEFTVRVHYVKRCCAVLSGGDR